MFFPRFDYHIFYILYPFVIYLLTLLSLVYIRAHGKHIPEHSNLQSVRENLIITLSVVKKYS
jgi:hypothetical protein